ncbi:MAG: hypothetical protein MGF17_03040 [Trichodesmium sp. MAG_R04]|nr:hypothetical protein [Trichodesmium sp. MAG_R04]
MAEKSREKYIRILPLPISYSSTGRLHPMFLLLTLEDIRGGFPLPEQELFP